MHGVELAVAPVVDVKRLLIFGRELGLIAAHDEQRLAVGGQEHGVWPMVAAPSLQDAKRLDFVELAVAVGVAAAVKAGIFPAVVVHDVEAVKGPEQTLSSTDLDL